MVALALLLQSRVFGKFEVSGARRAKVPITPFIKKLGSEFCSVTE
jgi:hypothetical protein